MRDCLDRSESAGRVDGAVGARLGVGRGLWVENCRQMLWGGRVSLVVGDPGKGIWVCEVYMHLSELEGMVQADSET